MPSPKRVDDPVSTRIIKNIERPAIEPTLRKPNPPTVLLTLDEGSAVWVTEHFMECWNPAIGDKLIAYLHQWRGLHYRISRDAVILPPIARIAINVRSILIATYYFLARKKGPGK